MTGSFVEKMKAKMAELGIDLSQIQISGDSVKDCVSGDSPDTVGFIE